jgi:hypothetical protein
MSCCGTFSPVGTSPASNPSHHVHFSTGMVLGVDDYAQEFAYHNARDKWIVREFGSYGTISGLAVTVEAGTEGAEIKVTAGSAATPGGDLVCVKSEQCGKVNAWLAREDIATRVTEIAGEVGPDTDANLKVWLTLCYTSCAIAPVPIPGQPCRSEEDLMAPSRIADDYILSLSLTPPAMTEAQAIEMLDIYVASMEAEATATPTFTLANLRAKVEAHLGSIFVPGAAAVPAAIFNPLVYHPDQQAILLRFIRNHWITRVRPHVMAQKCGLPNVAANDCVLLASFSMAATRPPVGPWEVAIADIDKDESDRSFLMSPMLAASAIGSQATTVPNEKRVGYFVDPAPVTDPPPAIGANIGVALVQLDQTNRITMPSAAAGTQQRRVYVRNIGAQMIELRAAAAAGKIEGQTKHDLAPGAAVLLISDGAASWRLASVAG